MQEHISQVLRERTDKEEIAALRAAQRQFQPGEEDHDLLKKNVIQLKTHAAKQGYLFDISAPKNHKQLGAAEKVVDLLKQYFSRMCQVKLHAIELLVVVQRLQES